MDQNQDIFSMSSEEFNNLDFGSLPVEETSVSSSVEPVQDIPEPQVPEVPASEPEAVGSDNVDDNWDTHPMPVQEEVEDEAEEVAEGNTDLVEPESEEHPNASIDYESEFNRLIGSPIKANGTEITIDSVDDAIKLIQMGANYYKKVETLKPAQKIISMLESKDMLDESKLSFAIDLLNKNPQAIKQLVKDMDLYDIQNDEADKEYVPTNYAPKDSEIALDEALDGIKHTDTYAQTVNVLGKVWDDRSRETIRQNPNMISIINSHMANGTYDIVNREVEKRKMFGTLPSGLSSIEAYRLVGDDLHAQRMNQTAPQAQVGQQYGNVQANVNSPKPSRDVSKQKRVAASPRNTRRSVANQMDDVFAMSSDDFMKKYGSSI